MGDNKERVISQVTAIWLRDSNATYLPTYLEMHGAGELELIFSSGCGNGSRQP